MNLAVDSSNAVQANYRLWPLAVIQIRLRCFSRLIDVRATRQNFAQFQPHESRPGVSCHFGIVPIFQISDHRRVLLGGQSGYSIRPATGVYLFYVSDSPAVADTLCAY